VNGWTVNAVLAAAQGSPVPLDTPADVLSESKSGGTEEEPSFRRAASEGGVAAEAAASTEALDISEAGSKGPVQWSLDDFPNTKRLIDAYRRIYRIPNKTPLSVLYEYASRLNLEVRRQANVETFSKSRSWLSVGSGSGTYWNLWGE
jgi:hypothetical protein